MWLFLKNGFLSIVKKEGSYVVRSRDKESLHYYFPHIKIEENTGTDYKYRIRIDQDELNDFFDELKFEINYSNFKNSLMNPKLKKFCLNVWRIGWEIFR